jgi:Domain of unknown function (DUF4440)
MQWSLAMLAVLGLGLMTPASAQDAVTGARKACENFNVLAATGDAAKLVDNFYLEKAMFIGPTPLAGVIIGREAIQKNYAEGFKTIKAFSADCENALALNDSSAIVSGHWMGTLKDPNAPAIKGSFGITFVKEGDKWLAALDSWNVDLPPPPAKSQ